MNIQTVSSLLTLFPDCPTPPFQALQADSAARGELYSLQLVLMPECKEDAGTYQIHCDCDLTIRMRLLDCVPVANPANQPDEDYLRTEKGLYPDILKPLLPQHCCDVRQDAPTVLWITVDVASTTAPGLHAIRFQATRQDGGAPQVSWQSDSFLLTVLEATLPQQELLRLDWFHADCLASYYQVDAWSERHWQFVEAFLQDAFDHGTNVLYTPLWTPPLDTEVGGLRPNCQLLRIQYEPQDGSYSFDFSWLERYLRLGERIGMKRYAMSHLFTQWGAKATPAVYVTLPDGTTSRRFGWDVPSSSPAYADFLKQLFPPLFQLFRKLGIQHKVVFAVSDEPSENDLETYQQAVETVRPLLQGYPTLEALSSIDFYQHGLVTIPVPCTSHLENFREAALPEKWTYTCCLPQNMGPNRFIAMPRRRIRSIGLLAFVYHLDGILHWGFNFYYTRFSRALVNPFASPDADGAFPAGDPFLVYPGSDGAPLDSARHEILRDALQDLRALRLLETRIGRDATLGLLGRNCSIQNYPKTDGQFLAIRQAILHALAQSQE